MKKITDAKRRELHVLSVSNGVLTITVIHERGMDIGEIFYKGEKISWDRDEKYLLHPDSVDLRKDGWDAGFYGAVASLGPEVFGTPDEIRTVHGTGSYSPADLKSVKVNEDNGKIVVTGSVPIRGYEEKPLYLKEVEIVMEANAASFTRTEKITNLTSETLPIDDGYHIQLCGGFMSKGGKYVLPVRKECMLLRDSAPKEEDPCKIYDYNEELRPIRCYQYEPKEVDLPPEYRKELFGREISRNEPSLTAEMLVNSEETKAVVVVRPLDVFPRSLIAKRNMGEPMYALEPCKTRPNSIRQKAIDGELMYLAPGESITTDILIKILDDKEEIRKMIEAIAR